MEILVNQGKCVGSGQCVRTVPAIFDQREEDGIVILRASEAPPELEAQVRKAARMCPARAISVI